MELTLTQEIGGKVLVSCDEERSHEFSLKDLRHARSGFLGHHGGWIGGSSREYGAAIFQALFGSHTPARRALDRSPQRILLVTESAEIQEIEWEYALGPTGPVALNHLFVRGLPKEDRVPPPALDSRLHVIAVPSDPLDPSVARLEVASEWAVAQCDY